MLSNRKNIARVIYSLLFISVIPINSMFRLMQRSAQQRLQSYPLQLRRYSDLFTKTKEEGFFTRTKGFIQDWLGLNKQKILREKMAQEQKQAVAEKALYEDLSKDIKIMEQRKQEAIKDVTKELEKKLYPGRRFSQGKE